MIFKTRTSNSVHLFFNTIQYLIFLPCVLLLHFLVEYKYRWMILFTASCVFYMYFIPEYILCLFFLILVDFYMAKKIDTSSREKTRKILLAISIVSNFGLLFYFKYMNFFTDILNSTILPLFNLSLKPDNSIILPIGLSFHTFQSVSYVIDVYKKKLVPERHLGLYSTYVLFFPQMVAGPIERFSTLGSELKKNSVFNLTYLKHGIPLIILGLFYKMVIADNCGEYVNDVYSNIPQRSSFNVLIAIFLFCIQIYSDFFGYSLIAQGSARLFNINLIDNFSFPFFSENIYIFWRKWHISLTSWFRDYVYFPLGGSKKSKPIHYFNILIVFALSGLWHGAGINFILWGLLHAVAYIATIALLGKFKLKVPKFISYLLTFIIVSFFFVFFRNGKLTDSIEILSSLFSNVQSNHFIQISWFLILNILLAIFLELDAKKHHNYGEYLSNNTIAKNSAIFIYTLFSILTFSGIDNLPFIYFQF